MVALAAGGIWAALAARLVAETALAHPWVDWPFQLALVVVGTVGIAWAAERWASPLATWPLLLGGVYLARQDSYLPQGWALWGASTLLALMVAVRQVPRRGLWLVPLTASCLYLITMPSTVGVADTFEFQVTSYRLGIAHPSGYPLYVLLGWLFSRLPVGSVAWRVNLTSVVAASATVGLVALIVWQLGAALRTPAWVRAGGSGIAAGTLAVSATFWSQALVAEVYALNCLLVALLVWLALRPMSDRTLWLAALVTGLALSHHLTALLMLPALAVALVPALWERRRYPRFWLVALGCFLLGLSPLLYLPLRWPAFHQGRALSWAEFWGWITGARFHGAFQIDLWLRDPSRVGIVARLLRANVGWLGLGLAGAGLVWAVWKQPRLGVAGGLAWGGYVFYALNYQVPDLAVFLLPAMLLLCVWVGVALLAVAHHVRVAQARVALLTCAALLPLALFWGHLPQADQRHEGQALYAWGRYALGQPLAREALVLADTVKFAPLYYLNRVEGVRPDLEIVLLPDEAAYREAVTARLAEGRAVYLARYLPGLEAAYRLRAVGPLVEVSTRGQTTLPPGLEPVEAQFGKQVRLLGVRVEQGDPLRVSLAWARVQPAEALTVRMRAVDASGEVWAGIERVPVAGLYPTNAWREDEVVSDYYELQLDEATPPGRLALEVAVGRPFSPRGLPVEGSGGDLFRLAELVHDPTSQATADLDDRLATGTRSGVQPALFDGRLALVAADMPRTVTAETLADVRLVWQVMEPLPDYVLRLAPRCGDEVVLEELLWGAWPSSTWPAGREIITVHAIDLPPGPGPCDIELSLEQRRTAVNWRLPWWPLERRWYALGRVERELERGPVFAGQIALVQARLDTAAIGPGDPVQVSLTWRGLEPMEEDYTVFVQALGPDGRLYGQDDAGPVAGTFPTSQWAPGVEVEDSHRFYLQADAPPGRYEVIAGWYLLSTMERLPVQDATGNRVADSVTLGVMDVHE